MGNFVFLDLDADGLQDGGGEIGVNGVTVNLISCTSTTVIDSRVTASGGFYSFVGLIPGSYRVQFILPAGNAFSPQNVGGNEAIDSDANTTTGISDCVALGAGDVNTSVDAGVFASTTVGNFVFRDLNADGVQDGGAEVGINGVTVDLLSLSLIHI